MSAPNVFGVVFALLADFSDLSFFLSTSQSRRCAAVLLPCSNLSAGFIMNALAGCVIQNRVHFHALAGA